MKNIKTIISNQYLRNIATLSIGTIIAQSLVIFSTPFITRIYTPIEIGIYSFIISIVSMFQLVLNGRYDVAIVKADDDNEADKLFIASILISTIISLTVGLGLLILYIFDIFSFKMKGILVFFSVPLLLANGFINAITYYNNRKKLYKIISQVTILRTVTNILGQIILGLFSLSSIGLIISTFISSLLGLNKQLEPFLDNFTRITKIKMVDIKCVMYKYRNQLLYAAPSVFLNSSAYSLINILIGFLYGEKELGFYYLSFRILGLPIKFISNNVAQVFYKKANSEKNKHGNFFNIFIKTSLMLLIITIPFLILVNIFALNYFDIIFGEGWSRAGLFILILSPMFAIKFIVSSLSLTLTIVDKQRTEFIVQSGFLISTLTVFLIAKLFDYKIETFLSLISIMYSLNYIIAFIIYYFSSKKRLGVDIYE